MKEHLTLLIVLLFISYNTLAQTYSEDPRHFTVALIDDFSTYNSNIWNKTPQPTGMNWGQEIYQENKVNFGSNGLRLDCQKTSGNYYSGGITTQFKDDGYFDYGYFEIESKYPATGVHGAWGGFWLYTAVGGWNEIDIVEPDGCHTRHGKGYNCGVIKIHNGDTLKGKCLPDPSYPNLANTYHKYAVSWSPFSVKFYFDDDLFFTVNDPSKIPDHPMAIYLTFQVEPDAWGCGPNSGETWGTRSWYFKNLKVYKLKIDCNNGITANNFNFSNHNYHVQKFYNLTNSIVPNNSDYIIRATDYIQLNGNFTVPLGSTFTAITHNGICPQ